MPKRKSSKRKSTTKKKRGPGRPKGSKNKPKTDGRSRAGRLTAMPTTALAAELERRLNNAEALVKKRDEIAAQLQAVETELDALGLGSNGVVAPKKRGRPLGSKNKAKTVAKKSTARRGRRPSNEMNLVEALQTALKGRTLSIGDSMQAVQDIGYKTTSPNFRTIVNQALGAHTDKFKKVARGQYTAK